VRKRICTVIAVGALAVGIFASAAPAGAARGVAVSGHGRAKAAPAIPNAPGTLYTQNDNDALVGIVSQDFTDAGFDIYDSNGADDFVVPAATTWQIQGVRITGVYFNGSGPADSEVLTFYRNAGGLPGAVIRAVPVNCADSAGSFTCRLPGRGLQFRAGTYWMSIQAVMAFSAGGEWAWETRTLQANSAAAWVNPGDGFATGCTTYANMQGCIGPLGEGPDFMFALLGQHNP
jgi:hypothetical protein